MKESHSSPDEAILVLLVEGATSTAKHDRADGSVLFVWVFDPFNQEYTPFIHLNQSINPSYSKSIQSLGYKEHFPLENRQVLGWLYLSIRFLPVFILIPKESFSLPPLPKIIEIFLSWKKTKQELVIYQRAFPNLLEGSNLLMTRLVPSPPMGCTTREILAVNWLEGVFDCSPISLLRLPFGSPSSSVLSCTRERT
jgi:hypothetical protein